MQSIWCDFIRDDFLDNEFGSLLAFGISGATSNPSIFKNAITSDAGYKARLAALPASLSVEEKFSALALADIKKAALKMAHIHANNPAEGFISYEISPLLANDYAASVDAALRVVDEVNMPNLMIKLPATKESIKAMKTLAAKGININATLIFSPEQAKECAAALAYGYLEFLKTMPNYVPQAVISIFVSRIDSALNDKTCHKFELGIANAIACAAEFINMPNIRALFASTGTKDASLNKDYYIQKLAFNNTINTAPLDAISALKAMPAAKELDEQCIKKATNLLASLDQELLNNTYKSLLDDGLKQFEKAYFEILEVLK